MSIRLNKLLAQRGIGARRKCDVLIEEGAVRVNGRVVRELGTMVEEDDRIEVGVAGDDLHEGIGDRDEGLVEISLGLDDAGRSEEGAVGGADDAFFDGVADGHGR